MATQTPKQRPDPCATRRTSRLSGTKNRSPASRVAVAAIVAMCTGPLLACSPGLISQLASPAEIHASEISKRCRTTIAAVRQAASDAGVVDAEAALVAGFPIFRVNRLLEKLGEKLQTDRNKKAFDAWAGQMLRLDEQATRYEIANLPSEHYRPLAHRLFGRQVNRGQAFDLWRECARDASRILLAKRSTRRHLIQAAKVPDNYSEAARFAGLFPVASVPVAAGWERWKTEHLPTFHQPRSKLRVHGRLIRFSPPPSASTMSAHAVRHIIERSRESPLGIPRPKGRDLERLFAAFAPHWVFDVAGPFDLPGHPAWSSARIAAVDIARPTIFTRLSHTMIGHRILLQLNYAVWFQERPRKSAVDLLGGALDGIIWRVTLDDDGRPLVYDTIHACGCYHLVFPVRAPKKRAPALERQPLQERPAVLSVAPRLGAGERIELRVASQTHYLQAISVGNSQGQTRASRHYSMASDDNLRSLPLPDAGHRSLFGPNGLVDGTQRLERLLLWPTGVLSPGAMRQWGHHAIAFADKRHFDDPGLFENVLGW